MLKGLIIKEFRHILRDPKTLLILFGMPLLQLLLFGFALSTEIKNAPIAILDHAKDAQSYALQSKIFSSGYFRQQEKLKNEKQIAQSFEGGKVKLVLVIPPKFAEQLANGNHVEIQVIVDASDINTGITLQNYAQSIIQNFQQQIHPTSKPFMQIVPKVRMMFNPELKSVYAFVPGVSALVLILISAMLTSVTIAREKELGTMEVISISPLRTQHIILGKVLPYLLLSMINAAFIILVGIWVLGMPMNGNVLILLLECLLYVLVALAFGVLISVKANTQQEAMFISLLSMMLPTIILSGFIFPVESMPWGLQQISKIIPASYFIEAIKSIMIKGGGFDLIWKPTLVLAFMATLLIILSIKQLKTRTN
ncbi:MAG: ABC transporter permease [Sphingobacteriales bacterium]|nr:ABC transporter permease [Sphingobacteriales bacterium]